MDILNALNLCKANEQMLTLSLYASSTTNFIIIIIIDVIINLLHRNYKPNIFLFVKHEMKVVFFQWGCIRSVAKRLKKNLNLISILIFSWRVEFCHNIEFYCKATKTKFLFKKFEYFKDVALGNYVSIQYF